MKFGYARTLTGKLHGVPPAYLRDPDWAASPQQSCFCLLGFFRTSLGFLERRAFVMGPSARRRQGMDATVEWQRSDSRNQKVAAFTLLW